MLNAAVIGMGWWGRQIVNCLEGSDRIRVVLCIDPDHNAVQPFASKKGIPLAASYQDAIENSDVEAVIVVTPHGFHEEPVVAAAKAGKQIFCEKPLALSADIAGRMLAACDENGVILGIGHERRYEGAFEELKRMAEAGELGTLLHYEVNASYNLFAGTPAAGWRQDPKQAPAGTLTALGVHQTDYMQTLAGPVTEVAARMTHRSADYPSDDILSIQFTFENGMTGYLCSIATTPFYQRLSLFGDKGWAEIREVANVDKPDRSLLTWRGLDEEIHSRTYKRTDTVTANLHAWADAVAGKGDYRFTPQELRHNVEILEAIVKSAESGKPVRIG